MSFHGLLIASFLFCSIFSLAQRPNTDSLLSVIQKTDDATIRKSANKAFYQNLAALSTDEAIQALKQLKKLHEKNGDFSAAIFAGRELAMKLNSNGQQADATALLINLLELSKQENLQKARRNILTDLGFVFYYNDKFVKSLYYFREALKEKQKNNDSETLGSSYANLGSVYSKMGQYDSASYYLNNAYTFYKSAADSNKMAQTLNNLGALYQRADGSNDEAIATFREAISIYEQMDDVANKGISTANIGVIYYEKEVYDTAITFLKNSLSLAEEIGFPALKKMSLNYLTKSFAAINEFDSAYYYQERKYSFLDSIHQKEQAQKIEELESKYRFDTQQQAIKIKDLKIDRLYSIIIATGLFLIVLLLLALYFYQSRKNKAALEAAKSAFFSNISHEFKTPLALISGPLEEIRTHSKDKWLHQKLSIAEQGTLELKKRINQLLEISKIENHKIELTQSYGDVSEFILQIAKKHQNIAQKKDIALKFSGFNDALFCSFDADKVQKIIDNLISNAIKFSAENTSVELYFTQSDGQIQISVKDSGRGMTAEEAESVFDRFYSNKQSNSAGTGLGLSLAKELAEIMGGDLSLKSSPGKGSTFTFRMPLTTASQNHIEIAPLEDEKLQILIAEDHEEMRAYLQQILNSGSVNCRTAKNGKEAYEIAEETLPDIIISDLMMPEMDGLELLQKINTNETTNHIPVLLLTAKSAIESRIKSLEKGAFAYLSKPFQINELKHIIQNFLNFREKLRQKYDDLKQRSEREKEHCILEHPDPFIQEIIAIVQNRINDENFNVENLSKTLHLSRTQVHRKIKSLTGLSTSKLIRNIRLEIALPLLEKGEKNVSEVAYECGFSSPAYFSKCFTSYFGKAPKSFLST